MCAVFKLLQYKWKKAYKICTHKNINKYPTEDHTPYIIVYTQVCILNILYKKKSIYRNIFTYLCTKITVLIHNILKKKKN